MKKLHVAAAVATAIIASACNSSDSGNGATPVAGKSPSTGSAPAAQTAQDSNHVVPIKHQHHPKPAPTPEADPTASVNYPVAIVLEGGSGDPAEDVEGKPAHKAEWRMYLCLEKTEKLTYGATTLDFTVLGNPIERSWHDVGSTKPEFVERLNQVVLDYSYESELTDKPTAAWGSGEIKIKSEQYWETLFQASGTKSRRHDPHQDLDYFDRTIPAEALTWASRYTYDVGNERHYVSTRLERFTFDREKHTSHRIEICEKEKQPRVFRRLDGLTRVHNQK